jgi:hypothetical protein
MKQPSCFAMSVDIDEYLMTYEHKESGIEDFIACLDLPISSSEQIFDTHQVTVFDCSQPSFASQPSFSEVYGNPESRKQDQHFESICNISSPGGSKRLRSEAAHLADVRPKRRMVCKAASPKEPVEDPSERRRQQNREAQRRRRERHMLASYRKCTAIFLSMNYPAWQ